METSATLPRSPLSLSFVEFLAALIVGAIAWFWLRYNLWQAKPWGWEQSGNVYPEWFIDTRNQLLLLNWIVALMMTIPAVSLVRYFRGNIRSFSQFGHFVLAWPLIDFLLLATVGTFGILCLPIAFVLALVVTTKSVLSENDYSNDGMTIPYTIMWSFLGYWYAIEWLSLVGD